MLTAAEELAAGEAHREMQLAVRAAFLAEFSELWALVDTGDLDRSVPLWLRGVWPLLRLWFDQSARTAGRYWTAAGGDGAYLPAVSFDPDSALGSLLVTGPGQVRKSRELGRSDRVAARDGLASASRSAGRLVLEGGRRTIAEVTKADPSVTRWQRITDGDPCAFCAMLAGRGPVYRSQRGGGGIDRFHDGCGCSVMAVRADEPGVVPETSQRFAELWETTTRNLSGNDAMRAFRQALEGRTPE